MAITMLYAGALALVLLVLSLRVIQARGQTRVYLGDGGNELMIRRMRGQANFVEYVPTALILMALLEHHGAPAWELHALGGLLLVARLLHGYAFAFTAHFRLGRSGGAALTQLVIGWGALAAIWQGLQAAL
jgi:uncharacterized membrane protein YecN with MAPEG domain